MVGARRRRGRVLAATGNEAAIVSTAVGYAVLAALVGTGFTIVNPTTRRWCSSSAGTSAPSARPVSTGPCR